MREPFNRCRPYSALRGSYASDLFETARAGDP